MEDYTETIEGYPINAIKRCVEKRQDCYIDKFIKLQGGVSFNGAAFLTGPLWFAYRLMWLESLIIILAGSICDSLVFAAELLIEPFTEPGSSAGLFIVVLVVNRVVVACLADGLYWKYIKRKLDRIRENAPETREGASPYSYKKYICATSIMCALWAWAFREIGAYIAYGVGKAIASQLSYLLW